jgi:penicillin-binding protein 1A
MFYNKFDFYYSANGVAAAAQVYFGKNQKDLTINEAAMFVGMFKNPYYYNPIRFPDRADSRRKTVLAQMRKREYITEEEYAEARAEELDVSKFRRKEVYNGLAPHFMSELKKHVRNLMVEHNITKPGGESYDLDNDGLRIYTTIDSRYQKHAEAAAKKHMTALQRQFENTWSGRDLWEYTEEGHENIKRRNGILNAQVESSERYAVLRRKYLGDISNAISRDIENVRLWNADIIRMYRAEQDKNYLSDLIDRKSISRKQRDVYQEIMSSEHWPVLKRSWVYLGKATKKAFNTKEKLTIPTYNGAVQKVMTPMDSIKHMLNHLQIGSVAMDPKTGYVKSWVGGYEWVLPMLSCRRYTVYYPSQ